MPEESQGLTEGTGTESQEGQVDPNSLASGFLKDIPDVDRPYVEKYINDWDSKVSQKFRDIHDEYQPYKELGSADEIKAWKQAVDLIQNDPEYVYQVLARELGKEATQTPATPAPVPQLPNPQGGGTGSPDNQQLQGLPPEVMARIEQQESVLKQVAQFIVTQQAATKQQEEDRQLNNWLTDLHTKHGEFDEDYVLLKVHQGMDVEKAIGEFNTKFGGATSTKTPSPPALSGGGVGGGPQNVKDMSKDQVENLVASILGSQKE